MEIKEILSKVDHTLLKPESTWEQIKEICDDGIKYETASVCIPPSFVKQAADYVDGKIAICTVIGFPNGYNTTEIKCAEAYNKFSVKANYRFAVTNTPAWVELEGGFLVGTPNKPAVGSW